MMFQTKADTDIDLKAAETDGELRMANDLMAKAHAHADYFAALHWLETSGPGYPAYQREHTRIALWKNEVAGALRLNTETMRLGEARLKMGSFSGVTTAPRHRRRGVCRALMMDALRYMQDHNYHVAMLFGIPNFYHQFRFTTALVDYTIIMDLEETLMCQSTAFRVREAKPGDIPAVQKIHAANDAEVACSLLRTSAHFTNKWDLRCCGPDRSGGMRVLTNDQGKVVAYFIAAKDRDRLCVSELGVAEASLCEHVLAACGRLASDETVGRIHFLVPPPHAFARFLLLYRSTHEMRIVRDSGGMMAFVNLGETLESLIPEWEGLLAKSALRDSRVEFTLLVDETHYRVRAHHGAIDVAQSPGKNKIGLGMADLMRLMTGYVHADDVLDARRRIITEEARALFNVLFPKRSPYVWQFDRF